ncbi:DsrE family protein [Allomuricauda sp. F6463D]|uniref:DsrE family protein n=1 Tax=Allomuricauda sp. F6463D TaxID=2926409 RepID=UPI001FF12B93|nr:DsrE family protein [Muricauda sp. F6463D]MCK0159684.1 DsrE family protein [Muricauda sp. F6463D]
MMNLKHFSLFVLIIIGFAGFAQDKKSGPVIEGYGQVWAIENPDFKTNTSQEFKVAFDVKDGPESDTEININFDTVARFLNMHAQSGIPLSQIKVALIVHGSSSRNLLTDQVYQSRYQVKNPNRELVEKLISAGVEVILCGQSSKSRDLPKEDLVPGVKIALSAMTASIQLQGQGYRLMKL